MRSRLAALVCLVLVLAAGCVGGRTPVVLRVLASSELADMQPVLDDLKAQTGIQLDLDLGDQRGTRPQARPPASIGGSNAPQLFVSTWCDIETRPCSNFRFLMSEFGHLGLWSRS